MAPVFGHGRLRLYLLRLLAEGPRHGYELIRLLEERFMGLYQPSAGTIYPRLSKLTEEGLVIQTQQGGRKVYEITDAGRAEVAARKEELDELDAEINASMHGVAEDVREEVQGTVRDMQRALQEAAVSLRRDKRAQQRDERNRQFSLHADDWARPAWTRSEQGGLSAREKPRPSGSTPLARDLQRRIESFADHAQELTRSCVPTAEQYAACDEALTHALSRLRSIMDPPADATADATANAEPTT